MVNARILLVTLLVWFLPARAVDAGDGLFVDSFESWRYRPIAPTNGSGGDFPGPLRHRVSGTSSDVFVYIPPQYDPGDSVPLMIILHGAAGPGGAEQQAEIMRDLWAPTADTGGFIVLSMIATGSQGGWIPGITAADILAAVGDLESLYNLDRGRYFGWGFSAGGHVMHAYALYDLLPFAGYAVSAGALDAYAQGSAPGDASFPIPAFLSVGTLDSLRSFVELDYQRFLDAGWQEEVNVWLSLFGGGHTVLNSEISEAWNTIGNSFRRPPEPP